MVKVKSPAQVIKQREYLRENYRRNKQYYIKKARRYINLVTQAVQDYKEGKPCVDCGKVYPFYVMQFHHRNPMQKKLTVGFASRKVGIDKIMEEIAKCDLLCANCHAIRTHKKNHYNVRRNEILPETGTQQQPQLDFGCGVNVESDQSGPDYNGNEDSL